MKGCGFGGGFSKPIETQYFAKVDGSNQKGMIGEYFDNMNFEGKPVLTRIDSFIDFNWGLNSPAPRVPKDYFSVRWTGKITPPVTRDFYLATRTDDGARLYLDDKFMLLLYK